MLKTLVKKQLTEIFRNYFYDAKKNKSRKKTVTVGYIILFAVLMIGIFGGMFALLAFMLCEAFVSEGLGWFYFLIFAVLAVAFGTFGSVFNTFSSLYLSKDNDLLLSMPISVKYIILSRVLGVYILGAMYSSVIMLPSVIVYIVVVGFSFKSLVFPLILTLSVTGLVLVLSVLLGYVVARISVKLKNKSIITVILSLAFLAAYYLFYYNATSIISELITNAVIYGGKIKSGAYPFYLLGRAGEGDAFAAAVTVAFCALLLFAVFYVVTKSFIKVVTSSADSSKRKLSRHKNFKQKSPFAAILSKEFSRFLSSSSYMLNCGLGTLFLVIVAAGILFKGGEIYSLFGNGELVAFVTFFGISMVSVMNDTAAPSVSLEGKTLWVLKSLPIGVKPVLYAKILMQLLLTASPLLLCIISVAVVSGFSASVILSGGIFCLSYCVMSALFGFYIGLKKANLDWTNEIVPMKQDISVMAAIFGGWVLLILLGLIGILIMLKNAMTVSVYFAFCAAVLMFLSILLFRKINTKGVAVFENL